MQLLMCDIPFAVSDDEGLGCSLENVNLNLKDDIKSFCWIVINMANA